METDILAQNLMTMLPSASARSRFTGQPNAMPWQLVYGMLSWNVMSLVVFHRFFSDHFFW